MLALLNLFGFGRFIAWVGATAASSAVVNWTLDKVGVGTGYLSALSYALFPGLFEKFYKTFEAEIRQATELAAGPAATMIKGMADLPMDAATLGNIVTGGLSAAERQRIGNHFADIIFGIFDIDKTAAGYLERMPGIQEQLSFEKFIGRNAQLQLAGAMLDVVKSRMPEGLTIGLGELSERMEKILGFEDAQEEILEPLMEKLIIEGLNKRYNRLTKPTDLPPSDAIDAYIRTYITDDTLKKILDNEGLRDDIRPILINLKAKNLTEADFRDLYQRGAWTRDDVFTGYRAIGYLEDDAQLKTSLILADREFKLRTELLNVKESQFVAGVLDEGSLRNFLATLSFSAEEEDLEIEIAKGKASLRTTARPKQITGTFNVAPWRVRPGATAMMSWNIRNADTITISGIGTVAARGERVITPDISQTYVLTAESDTDSERFEAAVQVGETRELKRPTASFSASPGRIQIGTPVELKWSTSNAETVSIDGIGQVGEAGAVPVFPFLSTIYTLRATNAQGTTVRQDIVFVDPPDVDFDRERRPSISFSITPGVVKASQPQAELNWSITRADGGRLTFPDGTTQDVSRNGALIVTATASGIYTLRASNLFGETQNQEALIFQGAAEEAP